MARGDRRGQTMRVPDRPAHRDPRRHRKLHQLQAHRLRRSVPGGLFPRGPEFPRHRPGRSEEHTSELQSLMRISYAVFCLKKNTIPTAKPQSTNDANVSPKDNINAREVNYWRISIDNT